MDKFEQQFEDLDVTTSYYENATSSATAINTPQEDVDELINKTKDEAGIELNQEMASATPASKINVEERKDGELDERLRKLRA